MEKISITEYGRRVGISQAGAYRRSRAGRIFLDKVKENGQVLYIWDKKKALRGLIPIKDDIRSELIKVSVALSVQKERVDNIIREMMRPEKAHFKEFISKQKS